MNKKETNFKNFLDGASIIALIMASLYFITYMYNSMYFSFFDIPTKYISISIDSVLNFVFSYREKIINLLIYILIVSYFSMDIKDVVVYLTIKRKLKKLKTLYKKHNQKKFIKNIVDIEESIKKVKVFRKIFPILLLMVSVVTLSIISNNYFYAAISILLFFVTIYFFSNNGKDFKFKFLQALYVTLLMFIVYYISYLDFFYIKKLPSVNIDNQEYVVINQSEESIILKKYLKDDTIKTIKDRKEFYVKEPKDNYEYSYVEFKKD